MPLDCARASSARSVTVAGHQAFGYKLDRFGTSTLVVYCHGLAFRLATFLALWLKDRSRKQ